MKYFHISIIPVFVMLKSLFFYHFSGREKILLEKERAVAEREEKLARYAWCFSS